MLQTISSTLYHTDISKKPFRQFTIKPRRYLATESFYRRTTEELPISRRRNHFDRSIKTFRYIATRSVPHPTENSLRYLAKITFDITIQNDVSQKTDFHSILQKKFDISQDNHFDRSIKTLRYIASSSVSLRYLAKITFDTAIKNDVSQKTDFHSILQKNSIYRKIIISIGR
jgi:hypothetical protein